MVFSCFYCLVELLRSGPSFCVPVKEPLVDGSWCEKHSPRPPKMLFTFKVYSNELERNYQVSSLSKQRHTYICYTTSKAVYQSNSRPFALSSYARLGRDSKNNTFLAHTQKINPWFLTGFTNGEGSFIISITEDKKLQLGWKVGLFFFLWGGSIP